MKLYIDDARLKNDAYDFQAKSYDEAIFYLQNYPIDHVSFDHDLGRGKTGYDIACYIEEQARLNKIPRLTWFVHSTNPVGRENIERAMHKAEQYWKDNG